MQPSFELFLSLLTLLAMLLCGRIFLVARLRLVSFPRIWERTNSVLEVRTSCKISCDGPYRVFRTVRGILTV